MLLASHDIAEAEDYCDRVTVLKEGIMRTAGIPLNLRSEQQHEFFLLVLYFPQTQDEVVL